MSWEGTRVDDIKVALHVFLIVLVFGTLWRLASFHLIASANPNLQHLGKGMTIQF